MLCFALPVSLFDDGPYCADWVPFYRAIFQERFKFLHVVRDGRDVAYGKNQNQYNYFSGHLYGLGGTVRKNAFWKMRYWGDVNLQVFKGAVKALDARQYFILRIEDLALPARRNATLLELLDFFDVTPSAMGDKVEQGVRIYDGHDGAYNGGRLSKQDRLARLREVGNASEEALTTFGYKLHEYGVKYPCRKAPACGIVVPGSK